MNKNFLMVLVKSVYDVFSVVGFFKSFVLCLLLEWWDNVLFKISIGVIEFVLIFK